MESYYGDFDAKCRWEKVPVHSRRQESRRRCDEKEEKVEAVRHDDKADDDRPQEVMWTALLLLCNVEAGWFSFGGPVMQSESQCIKSIQSGLEYARQTFPTHRVIDYQCVHWGEGA